MSESAAERCRHLLFEQFPELQNAPNGFMVVGGAVRDALLGRMAPDVDFAGERAEWASAAFARDISATRVTLGREPLIVYRVVRAGRIFDFSERVGDSLAEDLARRDFTINAMALDLSAPAIHDVFGGQADLEAGLVRMVRPSNFSDDPLRLLKGVRMAVQCSFDIEPATLQAIRSRAPLINSVAVERIAVELLSIFSQGIAGSAARLLHETALDAEIFGKPFEARQLRAFDKVPAGDPLAIFALAFLEWPVTRIRQFAMRFRWSDLVLREVMKTLEAIKKLEDGDHPGIPVVAFDAGREAVGRTLLLLRATGKRALASKLQRAVEAGEEIFSTSSFLTGEEIQEIARLRPGRTVGTLKRRLLEAQLRGEILSKESAVATLRDWTVDKPN
ncbi:MAG: hypothetical protein ABI718_04675 [Acidobacteriota bacterium]